MLAGLPIHCGEKIARLFRQLEGFVELFPQTPIEIKSLQTWHDRVTITVDAVDDDFTVEASTPARSWNSVRVKPGSRAWTRTPLSRSSSLSASPSGL